MLCNGSKAASLPVCWHDAAHMDPSLLEPFLTGAHSGLSLLFLLLALRQPRSDFRFIVVGCVLGSACLSLAYRLPGADHAWLRPWLFALAASAAYWFWALCRLLFEEGFALRASQLWLPIALAASVLLPTMVSGLTLLRQLPLAASCVLGVHLLWRVWQDRSTDLLEARRRFRLVFVLSALLLPLALVLLRRHGGGDGLLLQAVTLFAAKLLLGVYLFDLRLLPPAHLVRLPVLTETEVALSRSDDSPETPGVQSELDRLNELMAEQGAYRQSGLTITQLAQRLNLPEYRLRRLINQHLDYRNFNDYLNDWRLREAAKRLRDPKQAHLPILSIALDVGFGSIGPFNRAFKSRLGQTPSEFRRLGSGVGRDVKSGAGSAP